MIFIMVDFPAPFLPIKAILSFSLMTNDISLNSVLPLNSTASPSTEIINSKNFKKAAKVRKSPMQKK
jgi:hypothetical protein